VLSRLLSTRARGRLATHRREQEEAKQRIASLKQERDKKADTRKALWRREQELQQVAGTSRTRGLRVVATWVRLVAT
jgi:hypothetical protein